MRRQAGFTVLEVTIATAITGAVIAAMLGLMTSAHAMHQVQPELSDLQQRLRVGVDSLRRDLISAGAGLGSALPAILPYRDGELRSDPANGVYYRPDTVTVLYVPPTIAEAGVVESTLLSGAELHVDVRFNCGPLLHDALCGFAAGSRAIVFDATGARNVVTVAQREVAALLLQHRRPPPLNTYGPSARIAEVELHTYYLDADPRAGTYLLRHYDGFESDMPMLDDVVGLRFEYFGEPEPPRIRAGVDVADPGFEGAVTTYGPRPPPADVDREADSWPEGENCVFAVVDGEHVPRLQALAMESSPVPLAPSMLQDGPWCPAPESPDRFDADLLRIRRVRVTLRVQVASAVLRGPAGLLFARGGTATSGHRLVPDQELTFDVTPRNLR